MGVTDCSSWEVCLLYPPSTGAPGAASSDQGTEPPSPGSSMSSIVNVAQAFRRVKGAGVVRLPDGPYLRAHAPWLNELSFFIAH